MDLKSPANRLTLDGYGSPPRIAEDDFNMGNLLHQINGVVFDGAGLVEVVAVSGAERPRNNGVSGIVLAAGGHFACHTFSRRGVFFADSVSLYGLDPEIAKELIMDLLEPQELELREAKTFSTSNDSPTDADVSGFGQHLILRIANPTLSKARQLIDEIVSTIGMNKLCAPMDCFREDSFSIVQLIAESHIAIHAKGNEAVLDVFSCRSFPPQAIFNILRRRKICWAETLEIKRGVQMDDKTL